MAKTLQELLDPKMIMPLIRSFKGQIIATDTDYGVVIHRPLPQMEVSADTLAAFERTAEPDIIVE